MAKVFTSDVHFLHKNICNYTDRGKVTDADLHTDWAIDLWNREVSDHDDVYHLGDFCFAKGYETLKGIVTRLKGKKHFILGNHDSESNFARLHRDGLIEWYGHYKEIKIGEQKVVLFHFPITSWHRQHYGSWHLHGHCVDHETQILTTSGWKYRKEIVEGDTITSFNTQNGLLENDIIESIVDIDYSGEVIIGDGKSHDFNFTADHTCLIRNYPGGKLHKISAKELSLRNKSVVISSGLSNGVGLGLKKEMLQLHIMCTADGSFKKETKLWRVRIKKPHKVEFITSLLNFLGIDHKICESGGYKSFNFYCPEEIQHLPAKGLGEYLLKANKEDADSIFEAYAHSDGYKPKNSDTLSIYSAKEEEIDILQAMFCKNGYHTNKYSRHHGFGNNKQHQLSVTEKQEFAVNGKFIHTEIIENKPYWCVKTRNKTWIMRRNGVVLITGNCHGNLLHENIRGKMLDVGLDNAYNLYGEHKFFTEQMLANYMQDKEIYIADGHTNRTGE